MYTRYSEHLVQCCMSSDADYERDCEQHCYTTETADLHVPTIEEADLHVPTLSNCEVDLHVFATTEEEYNKWLDSQENNKIANL